MPSSPPPSSPVLLTGSAGMLGRAFRELFAREHPAAALTAATRADLDITSLPSIRAAIARVKPAGLINCAAWTDVDGAEANEAGARAVNAIAVANLATACREANVTLVTYSTDYVFDGAATSPYRIDHPRAPVSAYGRTKAEGEAALEMEIANGLETLNIRTSWLYAPWGKNFLRTIAAAALSKPALKVVNDQRGRPTSAEHLAKATLAMLAAGARGTHHVTDGGACTWFDFAALIAKHLRAPATVSPCTTAEFPRPAKRPAYSVLDLSPTEAIIGPMPDWTANVVDALDRRES